MARTIFDQPNISTPKDNTKPRSDSRSTSLRDLFSGPGEIFSESRIVFDESTELELVHCLFVWSGGDHGGKEGGKE